jgi:hypothetical protein
MPERDAYDGAWKEVLRRYFRECIELFLPAVAREIAWERGITFLDKELETLEKDGALGPRVADLLVKVYLRSGQETWILVHVEVQASEDPAFPRRMLVYHYRIFDRYGVPVLSFAILADDRASWRPNHFESRAFGTALRLDFPIVKVLDFEPRRAALEKSKNPFASVVLAHLDSLRTKGAPARRLARKWSLVRRLFGLGYHRDDVLALFRFLDEVLSLPKPLEIRFRDRLDRYQEEKRMPYVTSIERLAHEEGLEKGLEKGLERGLEKGREEGRGVALRAATERILRLRLGDPPPGILAALAGVTDSKALEDLVAQAALAGSFAAFEARLPRG